MATVTTYTRTTEVSGGVALDQGRAYVHDSATGDAFTLPASAPVGYWFILQNIGSGTATLTAPSGESMDGSATTLATDESAIVSKSDSTTWVATPFVAADA